MMGKRRPRPPRTKDRGTASGNGGEGEGEGRDGGHDCHLRKHLQQTRRGMEDQRPC